MELITLLMLKRRSYFTGPSISRVSGCCTTTGAGLAGAAAMGAVGLGAGFFQVEQVEVGIVGNLVEQGGLGAGSIQPAVGAEGHHRLSFQENGIAVVVAVVGKLHGLAGIAGEQVKVALPVLDRRHHHHPAVIGVSNIGHLAELGQDPFQAAAENGRLQVIEESVVVAVKIIRRHRRQGSFYFNDI